MTDLPEKREYPYSAGRALEGCFGGLVVALMLGLAQFPLIMLNLIPDHPLLLLLVWLFAVCFAGYYAARLGKTTGWTNSVTVAMFAELFLLMRLTPQGGGENWGAIGELFKALVEIFNDPKTHWLSIVRLTLTIPTAILGGLIWVKTGGASYSNVTASDVEDTAGGSES